ncbi:MAG: fused MFS/spermidine synthase [Acidobacteria bacterium]|nr:fused MFS/spermidine synthase [Acidobacteriota bacterium]
MGIYGITVFLSAFLLFLVQPLLAKYILPWFGGGPGVWTTSLLFFQVVLTAGYGWAHLAARRFPPRAQALATWILLALSLAFLPLAPSRSGLAADIATPTLDILRVLLVSVGATYFLLSATSPMLQAWHSRIRPGVEPYRLYTLANLGSLTAIAGYPLVVEPNLRLGNQTLIWSLLYVAFGALSAACAWRLWKSSPHAVAGASPGAAALTPLPGSSTPSVPGSPIPSVPGSPTPSIPGSPTPSIAGSPMPAMVEGTSESPTARDWWPWLLLPGLSSVMLLATTNQLCLDAAAIPLLWLLPMGVYLLSFILCFHSERWYSRAVFGPGLAVALAGICVILYRDVYVPLPIQIAAYTLTLFVCSMVCHGELVRLRPAPRHLTSFYLMISAGGAMGGVFVNLLAPRLFRGYWEFHLGLGAVALVALAFLFRSRAGQGRGLPVRAVAALWFLGLTTALGLHISRGLEDAVEVKRNFFGVLKVYGDDRGDPGERHRTLMHGRIVHGYQYDHEEKRYWPVSYYGPASGIGVAVMNHPRRLDPEQRSLRIGVIGLGTGTIATYGEEGDYFRFYEINPEVTRFAQKHFTYLEDTPARTEIVPGDARISMERELREGREGAFDLLVLDAFSSDAVPVHLLTRECYEIYRRHLDEDGILAVHTSSRYFNLNPVLRSLGRIHEEEGTKVLLVEDPGSGLQETDPTSWVLLTSNREFLSNRDVLRAVTPWGEGDDRPLMFTDDYSNLFRLLK